MLLLLFPQDTYPEEPCDATLRFLDELAEAEGAGAESLWRVVMETEDALGTLLDALREAWAEIFGVDLEVAAVETEGQAEGEGEGVVGV
jgi:hypothetical protein